MPKEAIDIVEYIETFHEVSCQGKKCKHGETGFGDEFSFAGDLWKRGWRISSKGTLYCPDCAKKHLKNLK